MSVRHRWSALDALRGGGRTRFAWASSSFSTVDSFPYHTCLTPNCRHCRYAPAPVQERGHSSLLRGPDRLIGMVGLIGDAFYRGRVLSIEHRCIRISCHRGRHVGPNNRVSDWNHWG